MACVNQYRCTHQDGIKNCECDFGVIGCKSILYKAICCKENYLLSHQNLSRASGFKGRLLGGAMIDLQPFDDCIQWESIASFFCDLVEPFSKDHSYGLGFPYIVEKITIEKPSI